jgi:alkylation response protein AidB-like acyl-CoA dehydrogenase
MVLDEALKIAQESWAPTNADGDRIGVKWENGVVTMPPSFGPAYKVLAEGGWIGCVNNAEFGGLGLPEVVGSVTNEFFFGANMSLSLTTFLTRGAASLIEEFGSDELRNLYCAKLYSGEWTGTMCLTEPQAGSDVGAVQTRAKKLDNGRYQISGEKIFITSGDHDLTDNIIHAVLARIDGAPEGTKGLSLFIVPKFRLNDDGTCGEPNDVVCGGIEEKLGIHGSPTCSMVFGADDGCEGILLGEEHKGMRLMFHMMNPARIEVGLQGQALAGAAHQAALAFARDRKQSRHFTQLADRTAPPAPIIGHPDVRRMLALSGAYTEAMRALLLQTSIYVDKANTTEGEEQTRYREYVDILTPICKAWCSDWGFRVNEWCLQVFGGYGYTREYPVEQYLRDAKIASIYEGTNGIQALDLVGRKLPAHDGRAIRDLLGQAGQTATMLKDDPELGKPAGLLWATLLEIEAVITEWSAGPASVAPLLNAVPLLDMIGHALGAQYLLQQASLARRKFDALLADAGVSVDDGKAVRRFLAENSEAAFYHNKVQTAIHFAYRALPAAAAHGVALREGEDAPMKMVM